MCNLYLYDIHIFLPVYDSGPMDLQHPPNNKRSIGEIVFFLLLFLRLFFFFFQRQGPRHEHPRARYMCGILRRNYFIVCLCVWLYYFILYVYSWIAYTQYSLVHMCILCVGFLRPPELLGIGYLLPAHHYYTCDWLTHTHTHTHLEQE